MLQKTSLLLCLSVAAIALTALPDAANAENILVVGDSLTCGPFGENLMQSLSRGGNQVTLYCAVSSTAKNWVDGTNPPGQKCMTIASQDLKDQERQDKSAAGSASGCFGDVAWGKALQPCQDVSPPGKVPTLASILAKKNYARVVVALGTNSLGNNGSDDSSYKQMASMVQGKGCDWIGPPHLNPAQARRPKRRVFRESDLQKEEKQLKKFYSRLADSIGSCRLIRSDKVTAKGSGADQTCDGVHRTNAAAKVWAGAVADQVSEPAAPRDSSSSLDESQSP